MGGRLARTDFSSALNAIAQERGLDVSVVLNTIEQAIVAAYRRDARDRGEELEGKEFLAQVNPETGEAKIFMYAEGKEEEKKDVTPPGFGRIAAQTAKQVILQKIREAEKDAILSQYEGRVRTLVSGVVLRFDGASVRVDIGKTEAIMPSQERIPGERLSLNQRLTFLIKEIIEGEHGREVVLSRTDPEIVIKLFAREVPEIGSGAVEIKAVAREAGNRTKVAVFSVQSGVDPVGSCVGQKGVRVQAVISELGGEKIDIILWTEDVGQLIASALAPAEGLLVTLDEERKEARVKTPEEQLALAIGRDGQNVRLASRLSGWKIEIEKGRKQDKSDEDKSDESKKKKAGKVEKSRKKVGAKKSKKKKEDVKESGK